MLLRHKLLIAAAAVVAAASAGGAYAATQSPTNPRQAFVNDVAKRLHVSPTQVTSAFKAALVDHLSRMVQAGQLTQAQAKRIEKQIESGHLPLPFDRPGHMGFRGHGPFGHGPFGHGPLDAAAGYLGLNDRQLLTDLGSGKSLAQIAKARGKSVSGLEQALIAAERARLGALVSAGVITKAQEKRALSRVSVRIGRMVNRTGPVPAMPPMQHGANGPVPPPGGFGPPASE